MGMHEIEDLVEASVRLLDRGAADHGLDLRSLYWNLYDYQSGYDTGNTLFRVVDLLVRHRYLYAFPLTAHPDYAQYLNYFESLKKKGFESIQANPEQPWHASANPTAGYYCDPIREWGAKFCERNEWGDLAKPLLYCEAGSPLWEKFVAQRTLADKEAQHPVKIGRSELFRTVIQEALRQENRELAAEWYQVGIPCELGGIRKKELARLKADVHLKKIHDLAQEQGLGALEVSRGFHEMEDLDPNDPFLAWWRDNKQEESGQSGSMERNRFLKRCALAAIIGIAILGVAAFLLSRSMGG